MEGMIHELGDMTEGSPVEPVKPAEPDPGALAAKVEPAVTKPAISAKPKPKAGPKARAAKPSKKKETRPAAKPKHKPKVKAKKVVAKKPAKSHKPAKRGPGRPRGAKTGSGDFTSFGGISRATAALVHRLRSSLEKSTGGRFSVDATIARAVKAELSKK